MALQSRCKQPARRPGRIDLYTCFLIALTYIDNAQRFFADSKPPTTGGPTPVSPSSESSVPPETVLKAAEQGMTNAPSPVMTKAFCADSNAVALQNPSFLPHPLLARPVVSAAS